MKTAEERQQQQQTQWPTPIADAVQVFLRDTLPALKAKRTRRDDQQSLFSRLQADAEQ